MGIERNHRGPQGGVILAKPPRPECGITAYAAI